MNTQQRLLRGIYILIGIVIIGTSGYMLIEGWSFSDSLFMTITTITTVGYSEVHPLSDNGQIFTIFLIIGGVGGAIFTLTGIIQYIIEGNFAAARGRRRMKTKIAELKGHLILCGYGRVGEEIARVFKEEDVPFVVIDNNPEITAKLEQTGYLYVQGDATIDEVLNEAGIETAKGLVVAVGSDADSTYITLSARGLRPDLFIAARATNSVVEAKLKKAGADRIIYPYTIGARRMAEVALRPAVVDFIDTLVFNRGREFQIENVTINDNSALIGLTLEETRHRTKAAILAVNKKNGKLMANPPGETTIEKGDRIITMGTREQLAALEEICERCQTDEKN